MTQPIDTRVSPKVRVEDDRSSLHPKALRRAFLDHLLYSDGHTLDEATLRDAFECLSYLVARPAGAPLDPHGADLQRAEPQAALLPLGRVPPRARAAERPHQPRHPRRDQEGARGAQARARRRARGGARRRPRQRRPRPPRRLLPRLARDARLPGLRLRHPLPVRHLRAGHPRRLAGREARGRGSSTATRGRSQRPERAVRVDFYGRTEYTQGRRAASSRCAGSTPTASSACPTTCPSRATAPTPSTRCGCGTPPPATSSTSRSSTPATTSARCRTRTPPRSSPRSSTPTTRAWSARSSG